MEVWNYSPSLVIKLRMDGRSDILRINRRLPLALNLYLPNSPSQYLPGSAVLYSLYWLVEQTVQRYKPEARPSNGWVCEQYCSVMEL